MNIYEYKQFIFDLDGTIINSEYYHYLSYKKQVHNLTYKTYQDIFHNNKKKNEFIKDNNIEKKKKDVDFNVLYKKNF